MLRGIFYGSLEVKSVARNADDIELACEVSGDHLYKICIENLCSGKLGLKNRL